MKQAMRMANPMIEANEDNTKRDNQMQTKGIHQHINTGRIQDRDNVGEGENGDGHLPLPGKPIEDKRKG
jgi:hypothetical protein